MNRLALFISLLAFIVSCAALHSTGHLYTDDAYGYDTADVGYDY